MAIRVVRHIAGRSVNENAAKLLAALPYGAGESLRHVRMDYYAATRADSFADQPSEINWIALDVPWAILLTHSTVGGAGGTASLDSAAEWDTMFRNLSLEYGTDGSEYYGGDADASTPDVPPTPGEVSDDDPGITRSKGPSGVVRLFSREVLMRPLLAEGEDKIRYFDDGNIGYDGRAVRESGGVVLIGAVRYAADAQTNFGVEFSSDRAKALKSLIGGDMQRVQEIIQADTGATGDALRTLLFGGDNYVEADTLKNDDAKAYAKIWASFTTPYRMGVV